MGFFAQMRTWAAGAAGLMLVAGAGCTMGRPAAPGLNWLGWNRSAPDASANANLTPPSVTQSPDYPKTQTPGAPTAPSSYATGNYSMTAEATGPNSANKPSDPAAPPAEATSPGAAPGGVAAGPGAWGGANPAGVNQGFYSPEYPGAAAPSGPPAAPAVADARGAAPGYGAAPSYPAAPGFETSYPNPTPGGAAPGFNAASGYDATAAAPPAYDPNSYAAAPPAYGAPSGPPPFDAAAPGAASPAQPPGFDPNAYAAAPPAAAPTSPSYVPPAGAPATPGTSPDAARQDLAATPEAPTTPYIPPQPESPGPYMVPNPYGQPTPRGSVQMADRGNPYATSPTAAPSTSTFGASPAVNRSATPHRADPYYRPGGVRDFFPNATSGADAGRSAVQPANFERSLPY